MSILVILFSVGSAFAGPPAFFQETMPEKEMGVILEGYKKITADNEIDKKTKGLIAIAVAAQIPCKYCVFANTVSLKKMGVTDAQIKEAVAMAGYIRLMSAILNGSAYDFEKFKREYDVVAAGS
ncbi:MAG: carboxymuconolactone decarboxylase family protein [Acidiferrobacterales bacterium]|nr:carboxymuconolactone decarboxylase family protein [Acidiferrobacterales bacterium]